MRRFFFDPAKRKNNEITLDHEESHHIIKVLRLKIGTKVELLDGVGNVYPAVIIGISRGVTLRLEEAYQLPDETGVELILFQSILKNENMDIAIQKVTELGVRKMYPLHLSRCQGKISSSTKKYDRWQRISLAACKQCMRPTPMEIIKPVTLKEALTLPLPANCKKILFWEEEQQQTLHDIAIDYNNTAAVALLIGPEGGITNEEVKTAKQAGWQSVRLGEQILRADTAAISSVTLLQYLTGNI